MAKKKLALEAVSMPMQDPVKRINNFDEVALGYAYEMAREEAERCLQCAKRPCVEGCPVSVPIPEFIKALRDGDMPTSAAIMRTKNRLPAICGRVCPQEVQCQAVCVLGKRGAPIEIGRLERYVGDWIRQNPQPPEETATPTWKKVAIVGAGPAGLTAAADLIKLGHQVTILEALHRPGGVLIYGIPSFRLPRDVVAAEVEAIREQGVEILFDWVVGKTATLDELLQEYDAVFLGTGAGLPQFLRIPGENLSGVYTANEFLTRVNLMGSGRLNEADTPVLPVRRVGVIGGGNVAMDAVRSSLRLGAEAGYIIYRRSEAEMPARREEVEHAHEEVVIFQFLTAPIRVLGDDDGRVIGLECLRMELGEPGPDGRRRPIPIEGSEFTIDLDTVVVAIGTSPNPLVLRATENLQTTRHGTVVVDEATGRTTRPRVWAGGDAVSGAATVILAMGDGRRAAADIDRYLQFRADSDHRRDEEAGGKEWWEIAREGDELVTKADQPAPA